MLMSLRLIRALCYVLGFAFLFSGFYYLLFPEHLFSTIQSLGINVENEVVFWKALAFAYMITISALSLLIAQNIAIQWRGLLVLTIAKLSSSLTGLGLYLLGGGLGLAIFVVDFPLAILFLALYLWILKVKG